MRRSGLAFVESLVRESGACSYADEYSRITVLSLSYVGAFTRHLLNFADVNVDTAHTTVVIYTVVDPRTQDR
jgi:hypothetical protein